MLDTTAASPSRPASIQGSNTVSMDSMSEAAAPVPTVPPPARSPKRDRSEVSPARPRHHHAASALPAAFMRTASMHAEYAAGDALPAARA